ncbi:MAG: hypothetical protein K2L11_11400 [Muribaculaceae bacterium]|nr:hypothetical protein [Muribaculaceae bacterium]
MGIIIKNKRSKKENILKEYPDAVIVDVTSKAIGEFKRLSPFYPHPGIPIPFTTGMTAMSVEGIWQGLKVFRSGEGIDRECFRNDTMKGLKRTVLTHGPMAGHRKGVFGTELLDYLTARHEIYVPSYFWVLEHRCKPQIEKLREIANSRTLVLLDYNTNPDINDPSTPLSHASLIKKYIEEGA